MMVMFMCNDIIIIEHDGKRSGRPNAPVVTEHNNDRDHRAISISLTMSHICSPRVGECSKTTKTKKK